MIKCEKSEGKLFSLEKSEEKSERNCKNCEKSEERRAGREVKQYSIRECICIVLLLENSILVHSSSTICVLCSTVVLV